MWGFVGKVIGRNETWQAVDKAPHFPAATLPMVSSSSREVQSDRLSLDNVIAKDAMGAYSRTRSIL